MTTLKYHGQLLPASSSRQITCLRSSRSTGASPYLFVGCRDGRSFALDPRPASTNDEKEASLLVKTYENDDNEEGNHHHHRANSVSALAAATSDSRVLLSASSSDKSLKLWDIDSGKLLHEFKGHTREVVGCALLAPELDSSVSRFVSASRDKSIKIWEYKDEHQQPEHTIAAAHSDWISCVDVSPFGVVVPRIYSGSYDSTVKIWDVENRSCVHTYTNLGRNNNNQCAVTAIEISPDDSVLVTGTSDGSVKLLDAQTPSNGALRSFE